MRYESNPKHKQPRRRGGRGSLCPEAMDRATAQALLSDGEPVGGKRYAIHEDRAYCAQKHRADVRHGYPVGWKEVPESLRRRWRRQGRLRRRDEKKKHWDG